jgi:hypothetical protein
LRENDGAIRSDLDAHDYVVSLPIREVVRELVQVLGSTTVAAIGGVKETRAVQQWTVDREPQRPHVLRFALQLALMLTSRADREFTQAWFHAANPRVEDRIPMLVLRDLPLGPNPATLTERRTRFLSRATTKPSAERHTSFLGPEGGRQGHPYRASHHILYARSQ